MTDKIYVELFTSPTEGWIASRCLYFISTMGASFFNWSLFTIEDIYPNYTLGTNDIIDARYLYYQINEENGHNLSIRPVIEVDLTKANIGITGDGSSENPYSITAK